MIPLTDKEFQSNSCQEYCLIYRKKIKQEDVYDKTYRNVRDHFHQTGKYRGAAHGICNLKFKTSKEILLVFHSRTNCYYLFIITKPAKEFEGEFSCLGEKKRKIHNFVGFNTKRC